MRISIFKRKEMELILKEQEENFHAFFNDVDDFFLVLDHNGNIMHLNKAVTERLGYNHNELVGQHILMLYNSNVQKKAGECMYLVLENKKKYCSIPMSTKMGWDIPVETRITKGSWSGKNVLNVVSKDISQLKLSEKKFSQAFHLNSSVLAITTFEGQFIEVNETFYSKMEYSKDEIVGHTVMELNIFIDLDNCKFAQAIIHKEGKLRCLATRLRSKSGKEMDGLLSADIIHYDSEDYLLTMFFDLTEQKQMARELEMKNQQLNELNKVLLMQANTDSLTRLYNHKHIFDSLQVEINRGKRSNQPLTIMMFDIDHFKRVNDQYGHQTGDHVLIAVADIIKTNLRQIDMLGRYGGEEFLAVLPNTDLQDGIMVANRIKDQIEQAKFEVSDLSITISIGITQYNNESTEKFISLADELLYRAKRNGRNRVEWEMQKP